MIHLSLKSKLRRRSRAGQPLALAVGLVLSLLLMGPARAQQPEPGGGDIQWIMPPDDSSQGQPAPAATDANQCVARILSITDVPDSANPMAGIDRVQLVQARILSGQFKGETVKIVNNVASDSPFEIKLAAGDRVLLELLVEHGKIIDAQVLEHYRIRYLWILFALFLVVLVAVGRWVGALSLAALIATVGAIWLVFIPRVLAGAAPIPIALGICLFSTLLTMPLVGGLRKKTLGAVIGTVGGFTVAAVLAIGFGTAMRFTGLVHSEAIAVFYSIKQVDLRGLLFSGIILGALGAIMDVCISIAGTVEELHCADPEMGVRRLMASAMNIGRAVMGTMTNTLVLAYLGSALPMLIIIASIYTSSPLKLMNLEVISSEVVKGLAGTIGLFLSIPLTALATAVLVHNDQVCDSPKFKVIHDKPVAD